MLVLAVIAITLGLVYALAQSSSTSAVQSSHQRASLRADSVVNLAPASTLDNLASDANWMPSQNPMVGVLDSTEPYQVDVQVTNSGSGRSVVATTQLLDPQDGRTLAHRLVTLKLDKQPRDNKPTAAIAAYATDVSMTTGPSVYVANGSAIRGNVRSKGPIQFQQGFALQGQSYLMGNIANEGVNTAGYMTYRASWGTAYSAVSLEPNGKRGRYKGGGRNRRGRFDSDGALHLKNVILNASGTNPMGVFYQASDVVLEDNVSVNGTLVIKGNLIITGTNVRLMCVREPAIPGTDQTVKSTFPAMVVDGSVIFDVTADVVRVSGLLWARDDVVRDPSSDLAPLDEHDHALSIDAIPDPFGTLDGPAIYIKGAIMANRVSLDHQAGPPGEPGRPFALVFDADRTDTTDAPGFFTWRSAEWVAAD